MERKEMPQGFFFQNQSALIFTSQKGLFIQSVNMTKFSHMWTEDDDVPGSSPIRIFKYKSVESNPEVRQIGRCN